MIFKDENLLLDAWKEYTQTRSLKLRNQLAEHYLPLVRIVAGRLGISLPAYVDRDDFLSTGFIGLLQAIERYDAERGVKFETYATVRIRGAILDALRVQDWIPASVRQKAKQYQNALQTLEGRLGRSATDKEIARELSMSEEQLQTLLSEIQVVTVIPLEEFSQTEESGRGGVGNLTDDFERTEVKELLTQAIERLPGRERLVMSLYYYEGLTLKEISAVMTLSEARISQLHTKGIFRLRNALTDIKEALL
ncbi:MAG: FliA/WhiG family RNA polymerase sigma factor [Acidaminococcales bacterium]|jgi:RNA polymerase sigma factor for flagellar operon FliA|nr:FliA/WhiG family RNA polymerase sigma factor [Acidaminococcales bacterium]